jgi:Kdo2-lipid IVA lauroyltransferase/acyltransferase
MIRFPKVWRHRLEYAGFRAAEALAHAAPLEIVSAVSGALWRRLGPWSRRHRRAMAHLAQAFPHLSAAERNAIAGEMWETLGRTFIEAFRMQEIVDDGRIAIENEPYWSARSKSENGWIVCSAHFGNWELAAASLLKIGRPVAGVYQKLSNPLVEARVRKMRDFLYPGGLFAKDPHSGAQLVKAVRQGTTVAILADQRDRRGVPIPFFGAQAPTLVFPALMARKLDAPLLAGVLVRLPRARFLMRVAEIEVPHTDDQQADARAATEALQGQLEDWIRAAPGQWMWSHRRWG